MEAKAEGEYFQVRKQYYGSEVIKLLISWGHQAIRIKSVEYLIKYNEFNAHFILALDDNQPYNTSAFNILPISLGSCPCGYLVISVPAWRPSLRLKYGLWPTCMNVKQLVKNI